MNDALRYAINETERRRKIQTEYNKEHGITPKTIIKQIHDITDQLRTEHDKTVSELMKIDEELMNKNPKLFIKEKEKEMEKAVQELDFETASIIRDQILAFKKKYML